MKRLILFVVIAALVAGWAVQRPAGRARLEALRAKASGERHEASWIQVLVSIAPSSWRPALRSDLRALSATIESAAVAPETWSSTLDLAAGENDALTLHTLFLEPTTSARMLDVHLSILPAGVMPHPIHTHDEEELILLMSGRVDVIRPAPGGSGEPAIEPVRAGQVVYHASGAPHTIRASEDAEARYLVFKWRGDAGSRRDGLLEPQTFDVDAARGRLAGRDLEFTSEVLFDNPTLFLKRLHVHVSRVAPGAGYPSERDPYDLAIVLLSGRIETVGRVVEAPAVVFYPADEPHDVRSVGGSHAEYVVIELHGHAELEPPM